jgi:haloalkane dehalogenase
METLRTPDEQFADLPDFPFAPNYLTIPDGDGGELRLHYLDEGPADAAPILLLHGEPSWSFLYRKVIPILVAAGHRCIAPDLIGFGRSDKPTRQQDHTYARHVTWMSEALFGQLDLRDITLVCQDWGGLIGLRLVAAEPERFARLVVANTGLPTGDGTPTEAFLNWQRFAAETPTFPVGAIVNGGCTSDLSPEVIAAYDAPFPDDAYQAGAKVMPSLVPSSPDDPARADQLRAWTVLDGFARPVLCAFSDQDPITKGGDRVFLRRVPGTAGQPHTTIEGGGHFLQEDRGPELAKVIVDFIAGS